MADGSKFAAAARLSALEGRAIELDTAVVGTDQAS